MPRLNLAFFELCSHGTRRAGFRLRGLLFSTALAIGLLQLIPTGAAANPITDENALTGTPQATWYRSHAELPTISGYTNQTSYTPGDTISFAVSTSPVVNYRVIIYRLGWYNGAGARQIACLPSCTTSTTGISRTTPQPNAVTGEVDDNWPVQTGQSIVVPATWATGEYIAEYVVTSSGSTNNQARYSPFVVRSTAPQASASKILVVVPHDTYLAYNKVGGTSAYINETDQSVYNKPHATKISYNRPYHTRDWSDWDYPLTRFLEREGYDVSYVSDTDVDANPNILQQHQMVIISGHSEYWTKNMRDGFQTARDNGVSLFFAGANDSFWQVRYEDSSCADDDTVCNNPGNRRTMVIYKEREGDPIDPISDPNLKTIRFRELNRSECELEGGVQWLDPGYFPNDGYANMTVTSAGAADPWVQGTGLTTGSTIVGMAGTEFDSFWPDCQTPAAPKILFQYQSNSFPADIDSASVKYQAPGSGARVFDSGNLHFSFTLDSWRWDPSLFTGIPAQDTRVQQFTRNVLADMQRPAPPTAIGVTQPGGSVQTSVTPRSDTRITSYKIYRHSGTSAFVPTDSGVTLVCQNATGSCTDNPATGTYRYAAVAVDQWNDSDVALSSPFTTGQPTAVNDTGTVGEDSGANAVDVLSNDQDPSATGKTIISVTQPTNGIVVITGGGTGLTYQPNSNYCNNPPGTSTDDFTYTLNGGSTATVSVTVNCVDDPPVAVNDSISLTEDSGPNTRTLTTNDTDVDGGAPKTIASVTQPGHGTVTIANATQITYTADPNYCNTPPGTTLDTFTYTLNGGSTAIVSVTVNCVDDNPVAVTDSGSVNEDAVATAIPVLANDTDVDGGPKSITAVTQPTNGQVVITGGGTGLTYKPSANYCNAPGPIPDDTFTYTLNGGSSATVFMEVICVDDPPVAKNDAVSLSEDDPATQFGPSLLANDTDIDGGPMTFTAVTQPANGQVVITGGGTGLTYQPNPGYCNNQGGGQADKFTYTLNGGSTATVSTTVFCVDDLPTAVGDTATVNEDAAATSIPVLSNDPDSDGGPKTVNSVTQPANGTVVRNSDGSGLTYQPNSNYCNNPPGTSTDDFTYTLNGGSTATVSVTVNCVDDPPVAVNDSISLTEDSGPNTRIVTSNDTDVDGGPKGIVSVTQPAASQGTVSISADTLAIVYTPASNYCNTPPGTSLSTFTYTLNGGSTATVSATVNCVDDLPAAADDTATVSEDAAATAVPVLTNDADVDGGPKSIGSVTQPANGTVVITGGGSGLTYQPNANYCNNPPGTNLDTFTYTLNGGSTATVSMTVTCVDDLPVAVNDTKTVTEDAAATQIDVLANDTDVENDPITVNSVTQPANGTVVRNSDGSGLSYQPDANYCNSQSGGSPDTFTYTVNGGDTATVSVTVTCVDDPPVAVNDTKTVTEDASATSIDVLANDTDIDSGPMTVNSVDTTGTNGNVVITGGGSGLTYQPNANYCNNPPGTNLDTFTYTLNGGSTATVSVTVTCVDDPPVAVNDPSGSDPPPSVNVNDGATPIDVLANDTDIDGGPKGIQSVTDGAHGTVAITGGGSGLTYTLDDSYCDSPPANPSDTFTYTLNGGSTATVTLRIDCTDPPTAVDDSRTVPQNAPVTAIPVLANDLNTDGGPMFISSVDDTGTQGTVAITGAGTGLTYQPPANYCNNGSPTDHFTYTLNGGSTATVSVTVPCPTTTTTQQQLVPTPPAATKKCKKGFKKVRGKCKKKKRKRKQ